MSMYENQTSLRLPCGGIALFDHWSGCSYRCIDCLATVGSVGMPRSCKEEAEKYLNWEKIGGTGWDYKTGAPKKKGSRNELV